MKFLRRIAVTLLLLSSSAPVLATVQAWLDRNQVDPGESVRLTLQQDGGGGGQPDLAPLRKDFDVLGTSTGTSVQIVNGHMSTRHQVTVTLSPTHGGLVRIPAIAWGGESSPPLELTVGGAPSAGTGGTGESATHHDAHVFLTSSLESPHPYVQAGDTLTVRLYADRPIYQASLDFPGNGDVLVQRLGKDRQTQETRDGHAYDVVERRYVLFPQRSGAIDLPGPVLDAQVPDTRTPSGSDPFFDDFFSHSPFRGMLNDTRPLRLHGTPVRLDVRPRPAAATGPAWLPARDVTLEASWQPEDTRVHAGEPVTLHLVLRATGLGSAQLPDFSALLSLPDGVKAYPDQAKLTDEPAGDTIAGQREQDIALIATRGGRFELPAIRLSWWDTVHDAAREVVVPAHTLDILPGTSDSTPPAPVTAQPAPPAASPAPGPKSAIHFAPDHTSGAPATTRGVPWRWVSAGLAVLWIATVAAWWFTRRTAHKAGRVVSSVDPSRENPPRARDARKRFQEAARARNASAARSALMDWAGAEWPHDPPRGLNDLAARLGDEQTKVLVRQLDRACYAGGNWDGDALAAALAAQLRAGHTEPTPSRSTHQLADLYP
ncbi:MAG: protein BatD [Betaproteobacteria bacterium]|nr:protein BatD [Betaproteobacteria bacterium]